MIPPIGKIRSSSITRLIIALLLLFSAIAHTGAQDIDFLRYLDKPGKNSEFLKIQIPDHLLKGVLAGEQAQKEKLANAIRNKQDNEIIRSAEILGIIALRGNDAQKALSYFNQALEAAVRSDNEELIGESLLECGIAYQLDGKPENALEQFERAAVFIEALELPRINAYLLAQTAQCHLSVSNFEKAGETFRRAAKAYNTLRLPIQSAACLNLAGEVDLRRNETQSAEASFREGIRTMKGQNEGALLATLHRNLGLVDYKKGKFEDALLDFNQSISTRNDLLVHKLRKDTYMQLFTLYSFREEHDKADEYHDKYRRLKDSLSTVELNAKSEIDSRQETKDVIAMLMRQTGESVGEQGQLELSRMITQADVELIRKEQALEEKTAEIEQLNRDKMLRDRDLARQDLQIHRQRTFRNLLLLALVAGGILSILIYNRYKFGRRSNRELGKVNSELQQTVQNLQTTRSQLVQSEKMAALGQLTAGIAHEIQNPLNFVNNFAEGAKELLKELEEAGSEEERKELTAELEQSLQKIHEHGKRAERIVKSMLQHSRQGNGEMSPVDLNLLLREAVNLAYHGLRATHKDFQCKLNESLHPDLPQVLVVPEEINRVFLNISNNAFYAMRQKALREPGYHASLDFTTSVYGDNAIISIRDNGDGIPKEVSDKIFQPFFTTKPSGQGTGLGLSMSYDIITRHGGRLTLDSAPGEFTEFTIALPLKKTESV
ncbi:MAG: hypothetical protein RLZZ630_964 [Bacteroidota bacterium]|jgi:signal transduction histidine kinase